MSEVRKRAIDGPEAQTGGGSGGSTDDQVDPTTKTDRGLEDEE